MQPILNSASYALLISSVLSGVVGIVLGIYAIQKQKVNRWLSVYYLVLGYGLFVGFLLYSHYITHFPWYYTFRTGYLPALVFMPVSYLYIRNLLLQKGFRPRDWVHFILLFVFVIDFLPFYLQSGSVKLQQAIVDSADVNKQWQNFSQGWMGFGFLIPYLRLFLGFFYWIAELKMIFDLRKMQKGELLIRENPKIISFAKIFCGLQFFVFIPSLLVMFFGQRKLFFEMQYVIPGVSIAITALILLINPEILYGLTGRLVPVKTETPESDWKSAETQTFIPTASEEPKLRYIPKEKLAETSKLLDEHFVKNRDYLNKGYSALNLAADLKLQPYLLSATINQVYGTNFSVYINYLRIRHAKDLFDEGQGKMFTMEALAERCGFSNRNSFTAAFKKHTGKTPSEYIKASAGSL